MLQAKRYVAFRLYQEALKDGKPRFLFASSNQSICFQKRTDKLVDRTEFRPDSLYGVTKCYGEALASYYYDKFDVETVSLRIGSCFEKPLNRRMLSTWMITGAFIP